MNPARALTLTNVLHWVLLFRAVSWPVFGIIVLSILVGSILGALLGMKLMRKHFVKAGLAQ